MTTGQVGCYPAACQLNQAKEALRMRKLLKIIGIVVGSIVAIVALAFAAVYFSSESRLNKSYSVDPGSVSVSSEAEVIAEGRRLASIRGCTDCHGADLGGGVMLDDPALGTMYASNLTGGEGGVAQTYDDIDFLRAIRHGIDSDGKGLLIMPSSEYYVLSDADVGALIAYINSLPAVDRVNPEPAIGPLGRLLFTLGQLPPLAAEIIDHAAPRPDAPEASVSTEFGAYLAISSKGRARPMPLST